MWGVVFAALVALIAVAVFHTERKEYKVHSNGIVLVTGASTGIGHDVAEYLAEHHNFLVLAGVRKESDFLNFTKENKPKLLPFMVDVSSHESCVAAADQIKLLMAERNLPFVALVNNAGVGRFNPIEFEDLEGVRKLFDTNVFGLMDLTKQVLPLLRASQGRVIMVSSLSGFISSPLSGVYAASKFAVEALSDALRREVAQHGVSVSVVQPGYVKTQIIATSRKATEEEFQEKGAQMLAVYPGVAKRAGMEEMMASMKGPEHTTTPAIVHALVSAFPKTRYPVAEAIGMSATTISWMIWALSDRLKDIMLA